MTHTLTPQERHRLNTLVPGQSCPFRGLTLTCRPSQPCQSGRNCTYCALHRIHCDGVACLRGSTYLDLNLKEHLRQDDIFFTLAI